MADFGTIALSNLKDPKSSFEWTRKSLTKTVNDFVRESLVDSMHKPLFGIDGMIQFPSSAPVPYSYSPDSSCSGRIIGAEPGTVVEEEYDSVAARSMAGGDYWSEFLALIGKALFRSSLVIAPFVPEYGKPGFSTPIKYNAELLTTLGSTYRNGNTFALIRTLSEWRKAGTLLSEEIFTRKITDPETLWNIVSTKVKAVATATTDLRRRYVGTVQRSSDASPGILRGYIYGSLKF
jgi:hypothetical protein